MTAVQTREAQYNHQVAIRERKGLQPLGLSVNQAWNDDPRHVLFTLSRYKFVAKMLSGKQSVLEVGCGDAFGSRIVQQEVGSLCGVDFDPVFVEDVNDRMDPNWQFDCRVHDMLSGPVPGSFDAAYSLDVIEHIPSDLEETFLTNIIDSLSEHGVLLVGTPSLESQTYASPLSKEGHINCKSAPELELLLLKYFHHCFLFSMNDEVVHTGYHKMAHYLFALAVERRL